VPDDYDIEVDGECFCGHFQKSATIETIEAQGDGMNLLEITLNFPKEYGHRQGKRT
jgi:hypothetical protein